MVLVKWEIRPIMEAGGPTTMNKTPEIVKSSTFAGGPQTGEIFSQTPDGILPIPHMEETQEVYGCYFLQCNPGGPGCICHRYMLKTLAEKPHQIRN
jgi:hypothetical protein